MYSQEIWKELESGKYLNHIDIKLTLNILKLLNASWLTDLYNNLISQKETEIIFNDWHSSGKTEAIVKGTNDLENLDPFVSVDWLEHHDTIECLQVYNCLQASKESIAHFVTQKEVLATEESDDEWEYDDATNIFEILDDEIDNEERKCTHFSSPPLTLFGKNEFRYSKSEFHVSLNSTYNFA